MSSTRDVSIDLVRSVACIAVVLMHITATFWYSTPVRYLSIGEYADQFSLYLRDYGVVEYMTWGWWLCSTIDALTRFSVPCFVMISGAMILNRDSVHVDYVRKKFFRILKIVIVWGTIVCFLTYITTQIFREDMSKVDYLRIAVNGNGVFWFLYMLLPLYLASPIFKTIIKDGEATQLFVILWVVLSIMLPFIKALVPSISTNVNLEYMSLFSAYTGYYLLGGVLFANFWGGVQSWFIKHAIIIYSSVILSLAFMVLGNPVGLFHNFTTPFCLILSVFAFVKLRDVCIRELFKQYVFLFARQTMGIYALHIFFLKIIKHIWLPNEDLFVLQIVVYFVFVISLSFVFSKLFKFIPFLKDI